MCTVTLFVDISYIGTEFCGFARQPDQLTVQGDIEDALLKVFRYSIETTCAGRTDSGVHAKHQYVTFDVDDKYSLNVVKLKSSLNSLTHDDISVNDIKEVEQGFSARFDAKLRKYSYFICNQESAPIYMNSCCWHILKPLDVNAMRQATKFLEGEHDFKSFCVAASAKDKTTMRNISYIDIKTHQIFEDQIIEVLVWGNAFLHSMVRTIVGSLVKVGTGNREPEWIVQVLKKKDRQSAGECAPANGLVLMDVVY